jgi:hypothetical protein
MENTRVFSLIDNMVQLKRYYDSATGSRIPNHPRWLLDDEKIQWKAQACHSGAK